MSKFLSGLGRFFSVLFAIAFVLSLAATVLVINFDRELLASATYKTALVHQQVYIRLPEVVAGQLVLAMNYDPCAANPLMCINVNPDVKDCAKSVLGSNRFTALSSAVGRPSDAEMGQLQGCVNKFQPGLQSEGNSLAGIPPLIKLINARDLEAVIAKLLPPDQLKLQTDNLLDQFFSYLNGQQDGITINLVSLKQNLASQASLEAVLKIISSQPACTVKQLEYELAVVVTGKGNLVMCSLSTNLLDLVTPIIQSQIKDAVALIPDTWIITPKIVQTPTNSGFLGNGTTGSVRLARLLMRLSPDIPLFFLLLVSILSVRTPKGLLRWWGIPLFFTGILSLGLGLSASALFERGWLIFLVGHIPAIISPEAITVLHDLIKAILQTYLISIYITGGVLTLLGLGMWIGSAFIKEMAEPSGSFPAIS